MSIHHVEPRHAEELALLYDISRALKRRLDLREALTPVLQQMAARLGLLRGAVSIIDLERNEIAIEVATGLTDAQARQGTWQFGEGITGQVIRDGKIRVIPRVSQDPWFTNQTGARVAPPGQDLSFVCVPIELEGRVYGAISADRIATSEAALNDDVRLLTLIASLIAEAVHLRIEARMEAHKLERENARLKSELEQRFRPTNIVGNSKQMMSVFEQTSQVAGSNTTVLLLGESGTGKELIASAIHNNSPRHDRPFIRLNCAALPESIIESELFGHERGSFTGAAAQRKGRFELADGGTIFLDEIGEMPLAMQVKLLRVLQEREFERVGGVRTLQTDVRVVAATNQDLEAMVEAGSFRSDLYYRLNVFPLRVPALRERRADILLLTDYFIERFNASHGKGVKRVTTPAIDMLLSYHWPGNVRELENCIERAVILSNDEVIQGRHLPPTLQTGESSGTALVGTLPHTLALVERELIIESLKDTKGNLAAAGRKLGVTERIMGLRVRRYSIDPMRFRA